MLMYDPDSLVAPIVYETSMITPRSAATKGKDLYYESYYYDVFRLNNRLAGLFAFKAAPSLGELVVTSVAGTTSGSTVITVAGELIKAYGLDLYYSANTDTAVSCTYGAALPGGATWVKAASNPFSLTSQTSGKYVTCALVNRQTSKVVASGYATEVVGA